jgi:uncharacterized protein YbjT (DUF2867 family)
VSNEGKRTILVTGATGAQGGSVARSLLERGQFAVRALTRNPSSEAASALRHAGAEVVQGDLNDPESIRRALEGCYGCFGVTNFWEHFGGEEEQGRNLVDAVAASDVQHFVFSSLPHVSKPTGGELDVPHFDIKARVEDYAREKNLPMTVVHVAFYYENFIHFFPPQRQEDGTFQFGFPQGETPLAMASVEDVGGVVAPIFERPEEFIGRTVGVVGDDRPVGEYAEDMSRVLGKEIGYGHIERDTFAAFGFPGAADLAHMFDFNRCFIPNRREDLEETKRLYPQVQSFPEWLKKNAEQFEPILSA